MSAFAGLPADSVEFYRELEDNNTKPWWEANKKRYQESVREPFLALAEELDAEFGEASVFRPHRDVRFSHDKSPYKTQQGLFVPVAAGAGWYLRIDATGLMTGAGCHAPSAEQLGRIREAIADGGTGPKLEKILAKAAKAGFEVEGEQLKTKPRGYADDHPRLALLRHKSLFACRDHGSPAWLAKPEALAMVRSDWEALRPLVDWFAAAAEA
ncbi:MAG: DUF2461 domain-containing protein [Segniliparus sp.]|uniref:DUF2461 domain-containing protein n=1 Tax=Segniliparus sp. TaxID=2804064 RepID=UPI003F2BA93E